MGDNKIIAVVGATGAQGGGLVRAILRDAGAGFSARALTRNPLSRRAIALTAAGATVVAADLDDAASIRAAFDGADAAFCVTFFWADLSPEKEIAQARTMADAARDCGVQHVVWSTLEDTRAWVPLGDDRMPTLMGRFKVPHFDAKGEANRLFLERAVPTTFLLTSFYWDNFIEFGMGPKRGRDGMAEITLPMGDAKLPGIAAEDIGACAYNIFKSRDAFLGKRIGIAGEHLTGAEMAAGLSRALGEEIRYRAVSPADYRRLPLVGAAELANMFQFKRDFQALFCGTRSVTQSRILNPSLHTFERWLAENRSRLSVT
jgi:uncharacterized protein YbjT (DUF2867 family)